MPDFLRPVRDSRSVSFRATLKTRLQNHGSQAITTLLRGMHLEVKAARPGSLRIEDVTTPEDMAPPYLPGERVLNPWNVFVSNGKRQIELCPLRGETYFDTDIAAPTLEFTRSSHRLTVIIFPEKLFATEPFHDIESMGEAEIENSAVMAYRWAGIYYGEEEWWYIARETGLPVRVSVFEIIDGAQRIETRRTEFTCWELNPEFDPATFDITPPHGAMPAEVLRLRVRENGDHS